MLTLDARFCTVFFILAAPNKIYRRAILQALEASRDFQSRSNLDAVRRHAQAILEDQDGDDFTWNDTIFLKTIKSVVQNGDVDLCSNVLAELSPTYKRQRANSLSERMAVAMEPPPMQPTVESPRTSPKEPPKRPREHEKWKIIPKKVYDKTT